MPPSMASMPSSMLQSSRSWTPIAPATQSRAGCADSGDTYMKARPAPAANTMPSTETSFGRAPVRARARARATAHPRERVLRERRAPPAVVSVMSLFIREWPPAGSPRPLLEDDPPGLASAGSSGHDVP